jgi:hypothetical protein
MSKTVRLEIGKVGALLLLLLLDSEGIGNLEGKL